jgi:hypothetical protein
LRLQNLVGSNNFIWASHLSTFEDEDPQQRLLLPLERQRSLDIQVLAVLVSGVITVMLDYHGIRLLSR